jgi:hypothetical protein
MLYARKFLFVDTHGAFVVFGAFRDGLRDRQDGG